MGRQPNAQGACRRAIRRSPTDRHRRHHRPGARPDRHGPLQLLRFAGCPICHLHVHQLARRHEEIRATGIRAVAVFHSEPDLLREYQNDLPFDVIGDPEKHLYRELGVETSLRSVLHPRTLATGIVGLVKGASFKAGVTAPENRLSLPADFLIGPDGVVLAVKYGRQGDDHWSVDELLRIASSQSAA